MHEFENTKNNNNKHDARDANVIYERYEINSKIEVLFSKICDFKGIFKEKERKKKQLKIC